MVRGMGFVEGPNSIMVSCEEGGGFADSVQMLAPRRLDRRLQFVSNFIVKNSTCSKRVLLDEFFLVRTCRLIVSVPRVR